MVKTKLIRDGGPERSEICVFCVDSLHCDGICEWIREGDN
jgi:hypothetical protein